MSDDQAKSKDPPAVAANIPPKLSRPLTCYGIFSVLERNLIWQQNQKQSTTTSNDGNAASDPYAATRPERYRGLVLPANWYVAGMNKKKRAEHKIHGKITFHEMTKSIAEKWRTVDAETRAYCEMIANDELARHKLEVAAFKEKYGEEAFKAQSSSRKSNKKRSHDSLTAKEEVVETSGIPQNDNSNEYHSNIGSAYNEVTQPQVSDQFNSSETAYSSAFFPNYTAPTNKNFNQHVSNTGTGYAAAGESYTPAADASLASSQISNSSFSEHLYNNTGTSYAAASLPDYAADLNTTKTAFPNNFNFIQQANTITNTATNTNNFNAQFKNNISSALAVASLSNYAANYSRNAVLQSALSQSRSNSNNQYNNIGMAYPAASFPNYTADFIRNLMQLQQGGGFNGFAGASSQLGAAQLGSSQTMGPQYQDQRLSGLSGDRTEDLEQVGNNNDNALSGEELDKAFDNDED